MPQKARTGLYLVTPPRVDPARFPDTLRRALDGGDVAFLQIRLKDAPGDDVRRLFGLVAPVARAAGAAVIINDHPALALELGADGTHIGQTDMPLASARALAGKEHIIGVTCHDSGKLAIAAAAGGASLVAFGAFFPTPTKNPDSRAKPELLTWWRHTSPVPAVAIGGIRTENCTPLLMAGASFLAVSSGVFDHPGGPAEAVRKFSRLLREHGQPPPPINTGTNTGT